MKDTGKTPISEELVIGLIGPLGVPFERIESTLTEVLTHFKYETCPIHLVQRLDEQVVGLKTQVTVQPYEKSCDSKIKKGNEFRESIKRKDAFALLALMNIKQERSEKVPTRKAFILRSLKTPEEIRTLRRVYGSRFILFGIHEAEKSRIQHLAERIKRSHAQGRPQDYLPEAHQLINTDRDETPRNPFGQHLAEAFSLSDVFLNAGNSQKLKQSVERVFDLLFGHPYITPLKQEYGMCHAYLAALRSAQLGRQVGAAIVSKQGEISVVGCNEVPKAGGGAYWPEDENDARDHVLGEDSNETMKQQILQSLLTSLKSMNWFRREFQDTKPAELAKQAWENVAIKRTLLMEIIDYGRAAHAEMSALLQAARLGIPVAGKDLYTTTFPCHNCAKHILKAGISNLYYIEPYPKSMAVDLHSDAIEVEGTSTDRVNFIPFVGIAPRLYLEVFDMRDILRKKDGKTIAFNKGTSTYRFKSPFSGYYLQEHSAVVELLNLLDSNSLTLIKNASETKKANAKSSRSSNRAPSRRRKLLRSRQTSK